MSKREYFARHGGHNHNEAGGSSDAPLMLPVYLGLFRGLMEDPVSGTSEAEGLR